MAWAARVPNSRDKYLALFNLDDHAPATICLEVRSFRLREECGLESRIYLSLVASLALRVPVFLLTAYCLLPTAFCLLPSQKYLKFFKSKK